MASIGKEAGGTKRILFYAPDGKRKTIRLGKCSQRQAEAVCLRVEKLVTAKITGHSPDDETARWLAEIDDNLRSKLERAGLVDQRYSTTITLRRLIDDYIAMRTDVKARTRDLYEQTRRSLVDYFGEERCLDTITPGDADAWRLSLVDQKLADNTIRRRCGRAKQFFKAAVRLRLIPENPFIDLKSNVQGNPDRLYFVTRDEARQVLDACPDAEWRLIFALSRYGGLRCPSEHLALRWGDVNWEQGRLLVSSPKTEHLPGGESRTIPLFPELRPFLEEAFELAEPGSEFVISRYRGVDKNLRTHLKRIVMRAGLNPWPKLFQNLRSSRETELVETFPLHVVCGWIGNSAPVAAEHYLQVTSDHFERALQEPEAVPPEATSAARNPARYTSELSILGGNQNKEPAEIPRDSDGFDRVLSNELPDMDSNHEPSG